MPSHTPSERRKKVVRLGSSFGGLLGGAVKALQGKKLVGPSKKGKKRKTRQQRLDEI